MDQAGNAYVTGVTNTRGPTFRVRRAAPSRVHLAAAQDAFVTKLNAAGTALLYSTYLGGSGDDVGTASPWTRPATPT